ncbi:hypothetical protein WN51_08145 [Melipona quadrifasciata]|uniref:Uncharacterized protein n=1 Tax=Melipona quadrifasciata TaxID=166423 RepID=A0A0N0BC15_9HYME|nr:hypothetical protein WN51_08145 [Melipona quadrifasciata]
MLHRALQSSLLGQFDIFFKTGEVSKIELDGVNMLTRTRSDNQANTVVVKLTAGRPFERGRGLGLFPWYRHQVWSGPGDTFYIDRLYEYGL